MRQPFILVVMVFAAFALWAGIFTESHQSSARASTLPNTTITVNGNGGDRTFQGIGAVLGGGGNARYLMDYPDLERSQILDYLFKPGYGASLQVLKLEIGGGTNSTDGAEPSIEPVQGQINCRAGYEFAIAQQAFQRNPNIKLYGLQWTAPSWVNDNSTSPTLLTGNDIKYLIDWLNCAKNTWGLPISYLGGWNEHGDSDNPWYDNLKTALTNAGYGNVQLVAGDNKWEYASATPDSHISILGAHDICGSPTEVLTNGVAPTCTDPPSSDLTPIFSAGQSLWGSELGGMDAGAESGCASPCAPAMDRALVRGYHQAWLTGYLEWPVLDSMPETGNTEDNTPLPYENRGLVTADQPWSGFYSVRAMTWAIAQFTQFVSPPTSADPGWRYEDSSSGYLQGDSADGAYTTLIHKGGDGWTTVIETTTASAAQQVTFNVSGGASGLAGDTVHVWSSNFDFSSPYDNSSDWLLHREDITPSADGTFTRTLYPGFVYTFTTTTATGQGPRSASPPAPSSFPTPYDDPADLANAGPAASPSPSPSPTTSPSPTPTPATAGDDEPAYIDAQDGSFELVPCKIPVGGNTTCTGQTTVGTPAAPPVFWHPAWSAVRYPYAIIGDGNLKNYMVSTYVLLAQSGTSAGLIGRYKLRFVNSDNPEHLSIGYFDGYVFDVSTSGAFQLIKNSTSGPITLRSGFVTALGTNTWHKLALSMGGSAGSTIAAFVDGKQVASVTDTSWTAGLAGIEAGYTGQTTDNWPQAQYSNLTITAP